MIPALAGMGLAGERPTWNTRSGWRAIPSPELREKAVYSTRDTPVAKVSCSGPALRSILLGSVRE